MIASTNELIQAAMSLPPNDRSYIADKLLESLDTETLNPEWEEELQRRLAKYEDGTSKTYSSQEVHQAALEVIGNARKARG